MFSEQKEQKSFILTEKVTCSYSPHTIKFWPIKLYSFCEHYSIKLLLLFKKSLFLTCFYKLPLVADDFFLFIIEIFKSMHTKRVNSIMNPNRHSGSIIPYS